MDSEKNRLEHVCLDVCIKKNSIDADNTKWGDDTIFENYRKELRKHCSHCQKFSKFHLFILYLIIER